MSGEGGGLPAKYVKGGTFTKLFIHSGCSFLNGKAHCTVQLHVLSSYQRIASFPVLADITTTALTSPACNHCTCRDVDKLSLLFST